MDFFKALVTSYIECRYEIPGMPSITSASDYQKIENSFDKYYEKDSSGSSQPSSVYQLAGRRDPSDPTFMEYHLSTSKMLELSHACGVSLTSLISAALVCAIRSEMPRRARTKPISLDVPVDLRSFFESATLKNFFGLIYLTYVPGDVDEPIEEVATQIQSQLKARVQIESLKQRMNRMIALEKNPFLRLAPLFVKDFILGIAGRVAGRKVTATVSNLGPIDFPEKAAPYIRDVDILSSTKGLTLVICSFRDDLSIGISSAFANLDVVRGFCSVFSSRGIEGTINSNRAYADSEQILSAKLGKGA